MWQKAVGVAKTALDEKSALGKTAEILGLLRKLEASMSNDTPPDLNSWKAMAQFSDILNLLRAGEGRSDESDELLKQLGGAKESLIANAPKLGEVQPAFEEFLGQQWVDGSAKFQLVNMSSSVKSNIHKVVNAGTPPTFQQVKRLKKKLVMFAFGEVWAVVADRARTKCCRCQLPAGLVDQYVLKGETASLSAFIAVVAQLLLTFASAEPSGGETLKLWRSLHTEGKAIWNCETSFRQKSSFVQTIFGFFERLETQVNLWSREMLVSNIKEHGLGDGLQNCSKAWNLPETMPEKTCAVVQLIKALLKVPDEILSAAELRKECASLQKHLPFYVKLQSTGLDKSNFLEEVAHEKAQQVAKFCHTFDYELKAWLLAGRDFLKKPMQDVEKYRQEWT